MCNVYNNYYKIIDISRAIITAVSILSVIIVIFVIVCLIYCEKKIKKRKHKIVSVTNPWTHFSQSQSEDSTELQSSPQLATYSSISMAHHAAQNILETNQNSSAGADIEPAIEAQAESIAENAKDIIVQRSISQHYDIITQGIYL